MIVRCGRELVSHYGDFEFSFVLVIEGQTAMIKGAAKRPGIADTIKREHHDCIMQAIAQEFPQIDTVAWERVRCGSVRNISVKLEGYRRKYGDCCLR